MEVAAYVEESSEIRRKVERGVEEPDYAIVERLPDFEVRVYGRLVQARVVVRGAFPESAGEGFRILSKYIFGGNRSADGASVCIEMTRPVGHIDRGANAIVSFTLPLQWRKAADLPTPLDPRISLVEIPSGRWAAMAVAGRLTPASVAAAKAELRRLLEVNGRFVTGELVLAQYDAPWALSALPRNEILVPIEG